MTLPSIPAFSRYLPTAMKDLSKYLTKAKKPKKTNSLVVTNDPVIQDANELSDQDERLSIKARNSQDSSKNVHKDSGAKSLNPQSQATIYRDLTGRVVDINSIKSKKETPILNTQREITNPIDTFTINKSDKEYNEVMKTKTSVEDPMRTKPQTGNLEYNKGVSIPNRFGIKAGVMWDGIDRSNGFELLALKVDTDTKATRKVVEDYDYDFD